MKKKKITIKMNESKSKLPSTLSKIGKPRPPGPSLKLPVIRPDLLKIGSPTISNTPRAVDAPLEGEFVYKPYDPDVLKPEVHLMPKPPETPDLARGKQPDYDWLESEVTPAAPVETPVIEPWESPLRLDDRQPLMAAREEEKLVNGLKNFLAKEYSSGRYKEKWLDAGVPEKVYDELVLPRVIKKINATPIIISSQTPDGLNPEIWERAGGVYAPPGATGTPWGSVQIRTPSDIAKYSTGGMSTLGTLAHEVGHGFSYDPYLVAIYNKFRSAPNPAQEFLANKALVRSGIPAEIIPYLKSHGLSAAQQGLYRYYPPEHAQSIYIPTATLAQMQAYELDSLLDLGQHGGQIGDRLTPGELLGYKWAQNFKKYRAGDTSPEVKEAALQEYKWRSNIEEIYADVKAVDAILKRPMTGNDIRETCMGVRTVGSAAINAVPSFRDFLNCKHPEKAASIFNKIVQIGIAGTGAAAVGASEGDGSQSLKEDTQNKINKIISEEIEKMLLEAPVIPASFADYLDTPHAAALRRKMDFLGSKHSLPYPQSMDVRPKEEIGGGYTDEFGLKHQKGSQRVTPGEQLKHEIAMGGMNWKQGVPGYYLPWGGPKDPKDPRGAPRGWIYQGPGTREGGGSTPVPPQRMGGSSALKKDPSGYFQRFGKGKRTWSGVPRGKNKGLRYGYIPGSELKAKVDEYTKTRNIHKDLEDETWQNYRGRSSFFSEDSGDLDGPIVRSYQDPKTGKWHQTTIVPMADPYRQGPDPSKEGKSSWLDLFTGGGSGVGWTGMPHTGPSASRQLELNKERMRRCANDPKCLDKLKSKWEKSKYFPGATEGFGNLPLMWPGWEQLTDYWTGIQSPGTHRAALPDESSYLRHLGVPKKATQKVFNKKDWHYLNDREKEVASFNYWERKENKDRIPELLKKQESGDLTDRERLELKGLTYVKEFSKIADKYKKAMGPGYEYSNPAYAGDVPYQFNLFTDPIEVTPAGIPAMLWRGLAKGGLRNMYRSLKSGQPMPTGLGGEITPRLAHWSESPVLARLAPKTIDAAQSAELMRQAKAATDPTQLAKGAVVGPGALPGGEQIIRPYEIPTPKGPKPFEPVRVDVEKSEAFKHIHQQVKALKDWHQANFGARNSVEIENIKKGITQQAVTGRLYDLEDLKHIIIDLKTSGGWARNPYAELSQIKYDPRLLEESLDSLKNVVLGKLQSLLNEDKDIVLEEIKPPKPYKPKTVNYKFSFGRIGEEPLEERDGDKLHYGASMNKPVLAFINLVLAKRKVKQQQTGKPIRALTDKELSDLITYTNYKGGSNKVNRALSNLRYNPKNPKNDRDYYKKLSKQVGITQEQTREMLKELEIDNVIGGVRWGGANNRQSPRGYSQFMSKMLQYKSNPDSEFHDEATKVLYYMQHRHDKRNTGAKGLKKYLNKRLEKEGYGKDAIQTIYGKGGYVKGTLNYSIVINDKYVLSLYTKSKKPKASSYKMRPDLHKISADIILRNLDPEELGVGGYDRLKQDTEIEGWNQREMDRVEKLATWDVISPEDMMSAQKIDALVPQEVDKAVDLDRAEEEPDLPLSKERLNEEKQHIAVDIVLKYNNDFSFYGYVLNQIRAIDGITIAKADEAGVVDVSPERQQILLHLKFMPIGSLSRYFWYLKNELKKIQDASGDKIDSVQIRGIPRQID